MSSGASRTRSTPSAAKCSGAGALNVAPPPTLSALAPPMPPAKSGPAPAWALLPVPWLLVATSAERKRLASWRQASNRRVVSSSLPCTVLSADVSGTTGIGDMS